jgi:putative colanic acid biosysnthesis UDP-glucose lipid carrier transferase
LQLRVNMLEQYISVKIPYREKETQWQAHPSSEISEIKDMFYDMSQRYLMYEPAAYYFIAKRAMDIVISGLFMVTVAPILFPFIAILVKLTSRGPVFFVQQRTGYKGRTFKCYKFRTMFVNSDADTLQATTQDKRITSIGGFLRYTHLDETPQFWNVLRGEMSVVGPRPHMLYHTRYYAQTIPYYNLRHEAQPGLTGMAQIKGYVGEISMERELRKRIQWDIYYLKNRSILLDVKIFFRTIGNVFYKLLPMPASKKLP